MAEIAAFRGIRYDTRAVGDLARVVSPPYDVISEVEREELEARSPYNVVRLVLPRAEPDGDAAPDKYTQARALLETWLAAGVLRQDDEASLTVYQMRARIHGSPVTTRGILAAVTLDEPEAGGVLPHEGTYDTIVEDRLNLLRATATNLDTIFCVYGSQDGAAHDAIDAVAAGDPVARFTTPDGTEHAVWPMTDARQIATVADALEKAQVVIADGHHRWRTARHYRDERRASEGDGPWRAQLMYLVDATRFGPTLLPIHRVIDGMDAERALAALGEIFSIEEAPRDPDRLAAEIGGRPGRTFAMLDATRAWWLTVADPDAERDTMPPERSAAWRRLDVSVLHCLVFDRLLGGVTPRFAHTPREAATAVEQDGGLAFLLAPMSFEDVRAVAETGEAMPQKSTYFVPKPATGIVLRSLDRPNIG